MALRRVAETRLSTRWGMFQALAFERETSNGARRIETALALVMGDPGGDVPLVRIHSQCITGEILGSLRCDCAEQLEIAMRAIAAETRGVVIYEYQEGRGIGLTAKLQAYAMQRSARRARRPGGARDHRHLSRAEQGPPANEGTAAGRGGESAARVQQRLS
jgi:GTP cyclohydrolase II